MSALPDDWSLPEITPFNAAWFTSGTLAVMSPSGIIKGCKSPNCAKLFLEFLCGPEYSSFLAEAFEQPEDSAHVGFVLAIPLPAHVIVVDELRVRSFGAGLATGLAWGVGHWILDVKWLFQPVALITGIGATIAGTVLVGFLSTYRILGQKPLPVLRRE